MIPILPGLITVFLSIFAQREGTALGDTYREIILYETIGYSALRGDRFRCYRRY